MRQVITIPGWHPTKLNKLMNCHWSKRKAMKNADRHAIWAAFYSMKLGEMLPPATGPRRVSLVITLGQRQRAGDVDCYWKSTLDALVDLLALVEDNRQWCELGPVTFERGSQMATTIILEDIVEGAA